MMGITFDFFQLSPKCIRRICRVAACQALYSDALQSGRKDLRSWGTGVLDEGLAPLRVRRAWSHGILVDDAVIPGPMTGCLQTADRLYQAGMLDSPRCRWCGHQEEDIHHLSGECEGIKEILGQPATFFPDQPHFLSHGLWEVPKFLIDAARKASAKAPANLIDLNPEFYRTFYVQGSATNCDHFFSRTLGFAACDEDGQQIFSHGFIDPFGSSFKAALLALWNLCCRFPGKATIFTSNKALVNVWDQLSGNDNVPSNIAFHDIWDHLLFKAKDSGFRVKVIFRRSGRGTLDMVRRTMDFANKAATEAAPVSGTVVRSWRWHVNVQRVWLCKLSKLAQACKHDAQPQQQDEADEVENEAELSFQNRFVKWDWNLPQSVFNWTPIQQQIPVPGSWPHDAAWWHNTVNFFQQIHWRTGELAACCFSVFELAFLFWIRTRLIPPATNEESNGTFMLLVNWLRCFLRTIDLSLILPGNAQFRAKQKSWCSQTFPKGTLMGVRAYLTSTEMHKFAHFVSSLSNNGKSIADWTISIVNLP
eukprot:Skav201822  [mRNA]  locus=scaffold1071:375456:377057:+ [translate_table: standard]